MKTQQLGTTDLHVSALAYGCMRITRCWQPDELTPEHIDDGIAILEAAVDAGYTFFDHANIYGNTTCETIYGHALEKHPDWREKLVVTTKCGIRFPNQPDEGDPGRYDFDPAHIKESVEASLKRLKLETLDLLQLHRPDLLADYRAVARALVELREEGKVRYFGVSNFRPQLVENLQRLLPDDHLQVNQIEVSLKRLDCLQDGCLDECMANQRTPLIWGPVAAGKLGTGAFINGRDPNYTRDLMLHQVMDTVGEEVGLERGEVALAWLRRHPSKMIPIVGTSNPERIRKATEAVDVELSRTQWYRLYEAALGHRVP